MARLLDQIVVVDVESTCWERNPPPGEESEIIEIGICTIDMATLERRNRQSILVAPQRSKVSPFCTQLTTLTQQRVDAGILFQDACILLKDQYQTKDRAWASYGDYDRRQFERQCQAQNIPCPFGTSHLNVKTLFAFAHGLKHEVGMERALEIAGFPLEGTHHRGGDDAWNIAQLLSDLLARIRNK